MHKRTVDISSNTEQGREFYLGKPSNPPKDYWQTSLRWNIGTKSCRWGESGCPKYPPSTGLDWIQRYQGNAESDHNSQLIEQGESGDMGYLERGQDT